MKKALVVFLILAVAGGLFAQTVTTSGNVQTGLGVGFTNAEDDKPLIDFVRNRGEHGMRGDIGLAFRSAADAAYGAYGANVGVRVRHGLFSGAAPAPLYVEANLFWQPSSLLWLQLGSGGGAGWGTQGGIDRSQDILDANGLKLRLTPVAGLSIVGHFFYGGDRITGNAVENMNYGFGLRYTATGLLTATANVRYYANRTTDNKLDAGAGLNFLGLSGVGLTKLALDVATYNLGEENFFIGAGPALTFATGGLTLGAKYQIFLAMGDALNKDFMPMLVQGEVAYKVSPVVTIGAEVRYLSGNKPNFNWRNASEIGGVDSADSFSRDKALGLGFSPQVTFNVGPTINVGLNLQQDLSDGATGKTQAILGYATVAISF